MGDGRCPRGTAFVAHPGAELYGSDRVLLESVSALVADGWRVVVTLPSRGPLVRELTRRGATVIRCTTPILRKSALSPRGLVQLARETFVGALRGWRLLARERPAVLYVNTVTVPLWLALARLRGIPVLCHVHEGEASAGRLVRTAINLPLLLAQVIVANSRFSEGVLTRSLPRLAGRTVVVYNGVVGPETVCPARRELTPPARLVYLGRLSPRKGVDVAVDALAILAERGRPATLDLIGSTFDGYEWYEEKLRELIAEKGLGQRVRFHGFQREIWRLVADGDVVVVPSRTDEPFGDTAVEALLAGRPVIASATSGLLEATAGYATAATVTPDDPGALADALETLFDGWARVPEAVLADREAALDRHSIPAYRERIAWLVGALGRSEG